MVKQTIWQSIKEWLAGKAWKYFLQLSDLSSDRYLKMIVEQAGKTSITPNIDTNETDYLDFLMERLQEYWDKHRSDGAVVFAKNNETGQTFVYTRGEYTDRLIEFIKKFD